MPGFGRARTTDEMRVGFGYDVHRLVEGRRLILGGVEVPHERGVLGHSDGDVLAHAIADALLGAAALGDIGKHFPDTAAEWKDADSIELLAKVRELIHEAGYDVVNVDATLALQRPKIRPFIDAMRTKLALALGLTVEEVSVKATTTEKLGFEGREEGVSAYAVCLIERRMQAHG